MGRGTPKKRRPGSLELRVYREERSEGTTIRESFEVFPARTIAEMVGLIRKRLRRGISPRQMMMIRYDKDKMLVRWVPDEWEVAI